MDFIEALVLKGLEPVLPRFVEFLEGLIADGDVLPHLRLLNIGPQFTLVGDDFDLKHTHLSHKVLVELVLVNFAAFIRKQLHFGFDCAENQNLFVFIQLAIVVDVEH